MDHTFSKEQKSEISASIRRFCSENLDCEVSDLQAGFLLEYFMTEIAPFAYNQGVEDARRYFTAKVDDLPGTCFQQGMTYWMPKKGGTGTVRRKPGGA